MHHTGNCAPAGGKDRSQVGGKNAVPVFDIHIRQQTDACDTGVVDQNVNTAESIGGGLYHFLYK